MTLSQMESYLLRVRQAKLALQKKKEEEEKEKNNKKS
jgi:hypothetical protein